MCIKISDLKPNHLYYSVKLASDPEGELVVSMFVYLGKSKSGEYQFAEWNDWFAHTKLPQLNLPLVRSNHIPDRDESGTEVLSSFSTKDELSEWIQSTLEWE